MQRTGWGLPGALLLALLLLPNVARAQHMGSFGVNYNNPVSASISNSVWSNWVVYQSQVKSTQQASAPGAKAPSSEPTPKIDETSLRFRPSTERLLTNKLADQIGRTPPEKQATAALLNGIYQSFDAQAEKLGKPNDLALALSFFLATNTTLFQGVPEPKDEQFLELRQIVLLALAHNGGIGKFTDQQKQELYELLIGYTGLAYAGYLDAKRRGDIQHVKEFQKLAGSNLTAITHLPPERFAFSDKGLTIKPE